MHRHAPVLHIHLENAVQNGWQQQILPPRLADHVHIIGPGLQHVRDGSEGFPLLGYHRQANQIRNEIFSASSVVGNTFTAPPTPCVVVIAPTCNKSSIVPSFLPRFLGIQGYPQGITSFLPVQKDYGTLDSSKTS